MQLIREETPRWNRQLRQTLVQGVDTKYYLVTTIKYYSFDVVDGRPNYEVNVTEVDENGNFRVLVQPHRKTFIEKEPSVKHHQFLLDNFDSFLKLSPPPPPPAAPAKPAAASVPGAQSPMSSGAQAPKSSVTQTPKASGAQAPKSSVAQAPKSSAQVPKSASAPPTDPAKS